MVSYVNVTPMALSNLYMYGQDFPYLVVLIKRHDRTKSKPQHVK